VESIALMVRAHFKLKGSADGNQHTEPLLCGPDGRDATLVQA